MAASGLQKAGIELVAENLSGYVKSLDIAGKATSDLGKKTADIEKQVNPANKAFDNLSDKLKDMTKNTGPAGNALGGFLDKLGGIPPIALAAVTGITLIIGAVVGLGAAFINLGERGAPLQEIGRAFDNITASIGVDSQKLLKGLQEASEGTVSNFELIKTASTALIGTSGELGKTLGEKLPEFLKIAKVQADATGKSVNELFNNLVEGVKKGTPKLIESTGLIIDQKAAYQEYAKSLGETVAQLSDTDRSMALLNATLDAGAVSIQTLGSAQESNADKLDRLNASTTNILDGIAVSLQPIFGSILDSVQRIINGLSQFAPYVAAIFQFVGGIISKIVGKIADAFSDPNLAKNLFEGAAATFGSFANGIIQTANKLIFPAILFIAKTIADFLIGFSPPKEGPLSVIDKGGENLMLAWLSGISGVSLDPVTKVAKQVSDALGNIGKQSLVQVNTRLAQLDKALLPFQNRLDIIKANFDALNEPAKAALDAIQRETDKLQDAAAQGNPEAIEHLKVLDAQREAIQKQVDAQQALVDGAQIQLGLAQAQQAPERALLTIRQKALQALITAQEKTTEGGGGALPKEKQGKTGATGVISPKNTGIAGGGITTPTGPSVLDLVGQTDEIEKAKEGIKAAFMGQIDQSGLEQFTKNSLDLGTQIDRIKSVDVGKKISDKFKGLSDAFDPSVAGSIANNIFQFFNGPPENPNSIAGIVNRIGDSLNIDNAVAKINAEFAWITDPKSEGSPAYIFATLTGDATVPGSAASFFAKLPQNVVDAASGLADKVKTGILDPVAAFLTGTAPGSLGDILNQAVGFFTSLPTRIVDALRSLGATAYSAIAVPIIRAINGLIGGIESGLQTLIDQIAGFVDSINNALGDAAPGFLKSAAAGIHGTKVHFGRISEEIPAFLQATPLAGATGGIFSKGFMTVGERGTELMYNASKMGVVPHELTTVLMSLESILAQPQPMPIYSGGNSTVNNSSSSFTFNGVQSDNDARRRYNYLRAGMR